MYFVVIRFDTNADLLFRSLRSIIHLTVVAKQVDTVDTFRRRRAKRSCGDMGQFGVDFSNCEVEYSHCKLD